MSQAVTGFGHRPIANVATHTGAGVRNRPVKEGAGLGHPAQRAAEGKAVARLPFVQSSRSTACDPIAALAPVDPFAMQQTDAECA
jgi:hypothetical protein